MASTMTPADRDDCMAAFWCLPDVGTGGAREANTSVGGPEGQAPGADVESLPA